MVLFLDLDILERNFFCDLVLSIELSVLAKSSKKQSVGVYF